jgi:SAM-dependent methyltransferase
VTAPRDENAFDQLLNASYERASLYDHAFWYDVDYQNYRAEEAFYRSLVDAFVDDGGCYAEIGAGTGRLLVPCAARGARVHAIEPEATMRARLALRAEKHGLRAAQLSVEDRRAHDFVGPRDARIDVLSFPFNGILHLHGRAALDDALAHAHTRLAPGGVFALDMTGPAWEEMAAGGREWGRLDERVHPSTGERIYTIDASEYDDEKRIMRTRYRYLVAGARAGAEGFIDQFMWTYQEMLDALERRGFVVDRVFGNVDFAPWSEKSPRLLVAAIKR